MHPMTHEVGKHQVTTRQPGTPRGRGRTSRGSAALRLLVLTMWTAGAAIGWVIGPAGEAAAQVLVPIDGAPATLDRSTVPAAGEAAAVLEVHRFGRYSVSVSSEQGVALQLVDRMAGPGEPSGRPGQRDGRLDMLLDTGEYLIRTRGHDSASGEAQLEVHPFVERSNPGSSSGDGSNGTGGPQLVPLRPVSDRLEDLEQRSYWLDLSDEQWVHLEAAGRDLADLRLWRQGSWLVDAEPACDVVDPVRGRPLRSCRLAVRLPAGLYLVTASGGEPLPWAEADEEHPLYLRLGIPTRPTALRSRHEMSPFGVDRWLVPGEATYFQLELPEARPAELGITEYEPETALERQGMTAAIDKTSREPVASLTRWPSDQQVVVSVRGEAGQPYLLQHFFESDEYRLSASGPYWISTIHSGHPGDAIEATSFLAEWRHGTLQREPLRAQTITVGNGTGWSTRCNLLDPLDIFVRVARAGEYVVESEGVAARFRIEPFLIYRPSDYRQPPLEPAGTTWDLDAGWYVLSVVPDQRGILEMAFRPAGLVSSLLSRIGLDQVLEPTPGRASSRFPEVRLDRSSSYVMYLNHQPGVHAGVILRPLPITIEEALPLTLGAGEEVEVPIRIDHAARLEALAEDGRALPVAIDGTEPAAFQETGPGRFVARVRNDGEQATICSLAATPLERLASQALPPLPEVTLASLPRYPRLTTSEPHFFDLGTGAQQTFLVTADDDALYRLETTGLLDTTGWLRSRTITVLAGSDAGGTGRNLLLHQYLLSGEYQVTVAAQGSSAGHLGARLTRTEPRDGGRLVPGIPVRAALAADEAVAYTFEVSQAGTFHLRSLALGRTPRCRLETGAGWPVVPPDGPADLTVELDPGEHRLVLLPEPVAGRRVTLLERVEAPPRLEGHGPHPLPLETVRTHLWLEPETGEARRPDVWAFTLAGPSTTSISLSAGMQATVVQVLRKPSSGLGDQDGEQVATVPAGRGWTGPLQAGSYELEVSSARPDNRVDYTVEVRPEALVPGVERTITAPAAVPISIGQAGLVEIGSFGDADVRASLVDASGRVVARGDDRPGDWSFHLAERLEPGRYLLEVAPVGTDRAAASIRVEARAERPLPAASLPVSTTVDPGDDVLVLPLASPGRGEPGQSVLVVEAVSDEVLGLALERAEPGAREPATWHTLATRIATGPRLELPLEPEAGLRVRVWSIDRRGGTVRLEARALKPVGLDADRLARGVRPDAVGAAPPEGGRRLARVTGPPGTLRLGPGSPEVAWSPAPGQPLEPCTDGLLTMPQGQGWLSIPATAGRAELRVTRLALASTDEPVQLAISRHRPIPVDLEVGPGRLVLAEARSTIGQPAIRLVEAADSPAREMARRDLAATGVAEGLAAALAVAPRRPAAVLWNAATAPDPVDARLRVLTFDRPPASPIAAGRSQGALERPGRPAVALALPRGELDLELSLTAGLVAAILDGNKVVSLHLGGTTAAQESFTASGDELLLLSTGAGGRWALDLAPAADGPGHHASAASRTVAIGSPLAERSTRSGVIRASIERDLAAAGRLLELGGSARRVVLLSDLGEVKVGRHLELDGSAATLLIVHNPGPVLAWLGPPRPAGDRQAGGTRSAGVDGSPIPDPELGLWEGVRLPRAHKVTPPARLELDEAVHVFEITAGPATRSGSNVDADAVLELRPGDDAAMLLTSGGHETARILRAGTVSHQLLTGGTGRLALGALTEPRLAHSLELQAHAVTQTGEGLGPEVLLAPATSHAFAFTVTEAGTIGIGVRAEDDVVGCRLLAADGPDAGRELGRGVVQMHELQPGRYLMLVDLPADAPPTRVRPAVVGLDRPPAGPPEEVVQHYLELGTLESEPTMATERTSS